MLKKIAIFLFLLVLTGCTVKPVHHNLKTAALPTLLPVRDFVANTGYNGHYRISPDGAKLAWKAVAGTREEIFVKTLNGNDTRSLGFGAQGYSFVWAQDSRRLLFIKDTGGNENFHLFLADINKPGQTPQDITPLKNTRVAIQQIIENDPSQILIAHNGRDKAVFDLYRLNLDSGKQTLLYKNTEEVVRLLTNKQGQLKARVRQHDKQRFLELPNAGNSVWSSILTWTQDDDVIPLDFTQDGKSLWLISNRGRDKRALLQFDVETGKETLVYTHPQVDIEHVMLSRVKHTPLLAYAQPDYQQVEVLEPDLRGMIASFQQDEPMSLYINSTDNAEQLFTVDVNTDREVAFYLYDRRRGEKTLLGRSATHAFAADLADMKPIQFKARDGLTLHGYLTLPPNVSERPLPMVVLVHGGPFARYIWKYNRQVQFLANRGYAVLQVNYRGSSGYGRAFMDKAIGESAGKMHTDLIDGVDWAIKKGIADPGHIAIMGRSYGGYATLVGLAMTPDTFACGIDIVGPADLVKLSQKFPAYWKPFSYRWRKFVGDPDNPADLGRMRKQSPLHYAARIKRPLLIIQGANDVRVKQEQSDRMAEALRAAGKPVEYIVISGEGHRIRHWKNRLKIYRATEDFLAQCLGGRSTGFDYYQLGSWLF